MVICRIPSEPERTAAIDLLRETRDELQAAYRLLAASLPLALRVLYAGSVDAGQQREFWQAEHELSSGHEVYCVNTVTAGSGSIHTGDASITFRMETLEDTAEEALEEFMRMVPEQIQINHDAACELVGSGSGLERAHILRLLDTQPIPEEYRGDTCRGMLARGAYRRAIAEIRQRVETEQCV